MSGLAPRRVPMRLLRLAALVLLTLPLAACESREPARLEVPVRTSTSPLPPTTNSDGWEFTVSRARIVVENVEFTQLGEGHARRPRWPSLLIPTAHAHPGHDAGGTVTGALQGTRLLSFPGSGNPIGTATILEGRYRGFNLTLSAGEVVLFPWDDPITGMTAVLEGVAKRGDTVVDFEASIQLPEGTRMVGGVFEATLGPDARGSLTIELLTHDPIKDVSLFEGVDPGELTPDAENVVRIAPGDPLHNVLRRSVQDHAFHRITWSPES